MHLSFLFYCLFLNYLKYDMMNFIFIKEIAEKKQKRGKEKAKTSDTKKKEIIFLNLLKI